METTLNIRKDVLEQIATAASSHGISRSALIAILIQKVMDKNPFPARMGRLVQYQKRCGSNNWKRFHVNFRENEYEYFLDLRKLQKMSVSLILAFAVKKYLFDLDKEDITDNYRCRFINYVVIKEYIDNIVCIKHFWGYPLNIEQYIRQ